MKVMMFTGLLTRAVDDGLAAAALVDRDGTTIGLAGGITDEEAMPLTALVMYRLKAADLASRLFAGEIISVALDDRDVAVGIARRQLFVVAILGGSTPEMLALVSELRDAVAARLPAGGQDIDPVPWGSSGGSGSGPAQLPLIELGLTVARRDRN